MCAMNPRLLRPLASGFNPRSISGLALWLDAADGSTLFQNSDGTTPATATSDPVGYWGDKSGNNRHATQATAANKPTITSIGSRKGLQYAASPATWLTTTGSNLGLSQPFTAFYAVKANASGGGTLFDGSAGSTRAILSGTANGAAAAWAGTSFQSYGYWKASDIAVGAFRFDGASSSGAVNNKSLSVVGSTVGSNGLSQHINVGAFTNNTAILPGAFGELLLYDGSLSDADAGRVIDYLARKWGITLAPQVSNADAQDWVNRVYANGGTVSESTAAAVNTFCNAIDAAGIRDRFYRLNLFAGTGLNAALVPLYRGPTFGGTTYGNATDTNNGPFVSEDYAETGATGGFTPGSSNSTKYLDTGLGVDSIGITGHISFYTNEDTTNSGSRAYMRMADANRVFGMDDFGGVRCFYGELTNVSAGGASLQGHFLLNRTAANSLAAYRNAVLNAVSNTNTTVTLPTRPMYVMASNDEGTAARHLRTRMCGYSMGLSFQASDKITSFYDAIETLNATLGRNA